jgi:hypothetical protein
MSPLPGSKYPYRVSSQVWSKAQGAVELVQALVKASCCNSTVGRLALY